MKRQMMSSYYYENILILQILWNVLKVPQGLTLMTKRKVSAKGTLKKGSPNFYLKINPKKPHKYVIVSNTPTFSFN